MMLQEPGIHKLLLEKTSIPVARIEALDTSHDIISSNYLIMERLNGVAVSESFGTNMRAVQFQTGRYLAELHSCAAPKYGYLGEHAPMQPQPTWGEAFTIMWRKIVDDIVRVGHYSSREEREIKNLVDKHKSLFEECEVSSLLHMDIWAQNILVDSNSNVTGIVDWDRALWGDVEIEFAVLDYCGISEAPFWEGYGKRRPKSGAARLRNVFYLLYEIQKYIVIRQGRQNNRAGALAYKEQVLHIINRSLV